MEISILLLRQIGSLVIMGLAGFWLRKMNFISHDGSKGISAVGIYICTPCILFMSFQTSISQEKVIGFGYALLAVVVVHILFFTATWLIRKVYPLDGIEQASVIYSNCGNLIIPLVTGVFGAEYIFYTSAYMFVANVLIWSHMVVTLRGGQIEWKKIILHPCMLSMFAGILFMVSGMPLPTVVQTALNSMGNCIGPLAMLLVGILIAECDMKKILLNRRIYIVTAFRLLAYPFLAILGAALVYVLFPAAVDPVVYYIVVLGASAPVATVVTQLSQISDLDSGYASSINVLTTLVSIVTMPLMIAAAQLFVR